MKPKKEYTAAEAVQLGLVPHSERTLRRMIASGRVSARDVSGGEQPRYLIPATELTRLRKQTRVVRRK